MRKKEEKGQGKFFVEPIKATEHQKDLLRGYFGGHVNMDKLSYAEAQRVLDEMKEG